MRIAVLTAALMLSGGAYAQDASAPATDNTTIVVHGEKPNTAHVWFRAESAHFIVYSDGERKDASILLGNLERFSAVLRQFSQLPPAGDHDARFTLYYLTDRRDLHTLQPDTDDHDVGLYQSCEDGVQGAAMYQAYAAKPDLPLEKQPEDTGLTYIFQAYARHFFYAHFPQRAPLWYIEGYAQYFSTLRFDGGQAIIGLPPHNAGALLSSIDMARLKALTNYTDVLLDDGRYHSDIAPGAERAQPPQTPDPGDYIEQNTRANAAFGATVQDSDAAESEFQARSWLLVHWILSSPGREAKLPAYMAAIAGGQSPTTAFRQVFGDNPAQLDDHLSKYLRGQLSAGRVNMPAIDDDVEYQSLPASADRMTLYRAALEGCPTRARGGELLAEVRGEAANYPGDPLAQETLSRAEILYGDPARALPWLEQRVQDDDAGFDDWALLGRAELATALAAKGDDRAKAFDAANLTLSQAAQMDPGSAANAFWYYRAHLLASGQLSPDAAGAAILAWKTAPEVEAYAFHAALVYAQAGQTAEALAMLRTLAGNPRPSVWAKPAAAWVSRIEGGATGDEIVQSLRDTVDPQAGQAEWTLAAGEVLGQQEVDDGWNDFLSINRSLEKLDPGRNRQPDSAAPQEAEQKPASEE